MVPGTIFKNHPRQEPRSILTTAPRASWVQAFLGALVIGVHLLLLAAPAFQRLEHLVLDAFVRQRGVLPAHPAIVYIEIAEDGLQAIGRWPWPRHYHAVLTHLLGQWGARAIVFDMLFSEPSAEFDDGALREALQEAPRVYLPVVFEPTDAGGGWIHSLPDFEQSAKGTGHINIVPDTDGVLRRVRPYLHESHEAQPHLALRVAYDYLGQSLPTAERLPFPLDADGNLLINWSGRWAQAFTHYSYVDLLRSFEAIQNGGEPLIPPERFKDAICLVGLTATGHADTRVVPMEATYPAVGVHANVINSILTQRFIRPASPRLNAICLLVLGSLALLVFAPFRRIASVAAGCGLGILWVVAAFMLFQREGLWLVVVQPLLTILSLFAVSAVYTVVAGQRERARLFQLATRDGLTNLYTIRHFRAMLDQNVRDANARRQPLSLLLLDVDHFKRVNDTHGHPAGDQVLKQTAQVIQSRVRQQRDPGDLDLVVGRYGGEEFVVMLRNCDLSSAAGNVGERLRQAVQQTAFQWESTTIPVTISVGAATLHPGETASEPMIKRADEALYQAKQSGRNRVCTEHPPT